MKFACSKCHISGSLKSIQKEYNIPTEKTKSEIIQDLTIIGIYKDYEILWRPYLSDDIVGIVYVVAKHGKNFQKMTGVSYKISLKEASSGWSYLGKFLKEDKKILYALKNKKFRGCITSTIHGRRVLACI